MRELTIIFICLTKMVMINSNKPFVITQFDKYRADLRDSYIVLALFILIDILFFFITDYSTGRDVCLITLMLPVLMYFIISTIRYHKKQKESMKIVLRIDAGGVYISSHGQIDWKHIKMVSFSKGHWLGRITIVLKIIKKNGSFIVFFLKPYLGAINLYHLRASLTHFSPERVDIKTEVPLWFFNL